MSVRAFSRSGSVPVFTANVLGRCFSRAGIVSLLCVRQEILTVCYIQVCVFQNECVWPGVTSSERIEIFNFLSSSTQGGHFCEWRGVIVSTDLLLHARAIYTF